jgi:hypothetical protein
VPTLPSKLTYVGVSAAGDDVGDGYTSALRSDGTIAQWGYATGTIPALPPGLAYVEVSGGDFHTVALRSDGTVVQWGHATGGIPALPAGLTYVAVSSGAYHDLALRSDGSVVAWGSNYFGQCDVPTLPQGLTYVEVSAGGYVERIGPPVPYGHSMARRSDGTVVAWGGNHFGQCDVPALPAGLTYVEISAGAVHSVARRSDGAVVAWGDDSDGRCVVPPLPAGLTYVEVSAGGYEDGLGLPRGHSLARRSDGSVVAWGSNTDGQCDVPGLPGGLVYVEVSAGDSHSVARIAPGPACGSVSISCWPGAPNSVSSQGAHTQARGCPGLTANDLVLEVSRLPAGALGLFLYGSQQQQTPLGNGWGCVTGSVQRIMSPLTASSAGVVDYPIDLTRFPFAGSAHAIHPGSSWVFQFWYRDSLGSPTTFNSSNAVQVVFAP